MKKAVLVFLLVLVSMFVFAQKVTLQIEGSAVPYYIPIYMGIELGYFEEEGLEVDYLFGSASDIIRNVAVGNVEFGFPNGEPVITARAQGIPVNVIHTTYQHGLGSTIFLKESGIETPQDLKGKKVAITGYGSPNYVQLQILLKKNGLSLNDIQLEIVGTEAIVPALVNKRVDAICFSMLRTFELRYQGIEVDEFKSDEFLPSFGNVVVTGDKILNENRDLAVRFTRALSRVMAYLSDPDNMKEATVVAIAKYAPTYIGREEYMADILSEIYAGYLWQSEDTEAFGFGFGNVERWQQTIDIMREYDLITTDVNAADFVVPRL
ncbi:myristoyl transferase [Mesotoga sp. Brook.08.105.5.1]|uniref:ABC transporter substrate-binding protein n=1 Tax=Mesotoga sp. Brook.08.105.5.1 TaxID=1421002 RepID=UPI000C17E193|nr:ABC transporter substrate-binding protein [Mesotoga sp. Brook.08.105.5.1]PVD17881.1 myristoyl transferase [Mesotoga sp. Brook.08.105.5.1]